MQRKPFCKNGHEMSEENTYRCKARPTRNQCRRCKIEWQRGKHLVERRAWIKEWRKRTGYRWQEKDIAKRRARGLVGTWVYRGKIVRPDHCHKCGLICAPQAHHPDYSKPAEFAWLCVMCHAAEHHSREADQLMR
jgi:hypothetical protein